jgi:hypothetical protein
MTPSEINARIRSEAYDRDIGQSGWLLASELRQLIEWLIPPRGGKLLDIGAGAPPLHLVAGSHGA